MRKPYVIVIGRQFGSGGHEIGEKLAKRLGIPLYDKDILAKIAEEKGIAADLLHKMDENLKGNRWFNVGLQAKGMGVLGSSFLFETDTSAVIDRDKVFTWQSQLIRELAEKEDCIIIGRCADYVLKDHPGLISIFVTAPLAAREARIEERYPNHQKDAYETYNEFIRRTDRARASYYSFHTDRDWGDIGNYHLVVDATRLGIDGTVNMLEDYVKHCAE